MDPLYVGALGMSSDNVSHIPDFSVNLGRLKRCHFPLTRRRENRLAYFGYFVYKENVLEASAIDRSYTEASDDTFEKGPAVSFQGLTSVRQPYTIGTDRQQGGC